MESLNPSLKALTVLLCALLLSFTYTLSVNLTVLGICAMLLLLCSRASLGRMVRILLPAVLAAVSIFFTGLVFGSAATDTAATVSPSTLEFGVLSYSLDSLELALQLATRLLAYAFLGILFSLTTDGEDFVRSLMAQAHLKASYAYGVLAALHLIPRLHQEFRAVQRAYRARGIVIHALSFGPVFSTLVTTIQWAEKVSMAMESKGFDGNAPRTCYRQIAVHARDWIFLAGMCLAVLSGLL